MQAERLGFKAEAIELRSVSVRTEAIHSWLGRGDYRLMEDSLPVL